MLRAHTSTRLLDDTDDQNQNDDRLSVAAIFFIVLAAVALFVVGMLYICSYIRGRHRNNEQVRTKNIVIELPDEAPTADEDTSTLEPIDLVSCESECSIQEKDVLDHESALPDPSEIGRHHAALDVHYCTSACCDVCRQDVAYPCFLTVGQPSDTMQKNNKIVDDDEEPSKVHLETGINLATASNYKGNNSIDAFAANDKKDPKDDGSNSDSVETKCSASGSNGEDGDISKSQSRITPPKGQVRISITNSDSAASEEDMEQLLD